MGSELLLILSLLSGYIFIHATHYFRYRAQTLDGTRLLFETAAAGIPFLIFARLFVTTDLWPTWARSSWDQLAGIVPYSGSIVGAAGLAVIAASGVNLFVGLWDLHGKKCKGHDKAGVVVRHLAASRCFSLDRAVNRYGNSVQLALHQAATRADDGELVGVTLGNRRIYAGYVSRLPDLTPNDGFVELLPVMSGRRDPVDLSVHYDYVYPRFANSAGDNPKLEIPVILPISQIQSLHRLDLTDLEGVAAALDRKAPDAAPGPVTATPHSAGGAVSPEPSADAPPRASAPGSG